MPKSASKIPISGEASSAHVKSYKTKNVSPGKASAKTSASGGSMIKVTCCLTRSRDMLLLVEKANGSPPFVYLTNRWMHANMDFCFRTLGVDHVLNRVSHDDPNEYMTETQGNNDRTWTIYLKIVDGAHSHLANAENRRRWAETFVHFFNHANNQSLYRFPQRAYYAGDITPQNEDEAPYMSEFLTLHDTMQVMRQALGHDELPHDAEYHNSDGLLPITSVLENEAAMADYYSPAHLPLARRRFLISYGGGSAVPQDAPDSRFEGLPDFTFLP